MQRRLWQRGEACICQTSSVVFAVGVFHGDKRTAETAQHFEMAHKCGVRRFASFDRSDINPLPFLVTTFSSPPGLTR
jgi:hypothetical protein